MIYDNIIIGSGPTAATAANKLLKLNKKVTIIDIGNNIEKKNLKIKNNYLKTKNKKKILKSIKKNKILNKYKNPSQVSFDQNLFLKNNMKILLDQKFRYYFIKCLWWPI